MWNSFLDAVSSLPYVPAVHFVSLPGVYGGSILFSVQVHFVPFSFVMLCQVVGKQTGDTAEYFSMQGDMGSGEAAGFLKLPKCEGHVSMTPEFLLHVDVYNKVTNDNTCGSHVVAIAVL